MTKALFDAEKELKEARRALNRAKQNVQNAHFEELDAREYLTNMEARYLKILIAVATKGWVT